MKKLIITFFIMLFITTLVFSQSQATRFYNVNDTATPPTIDGVISSGEYADADPAQGEFRLLRTPVPGTLATENIQFQALQDAKISILSLQLTIMISLSLPQQLMIV